MDQATRTYYKIDGHENLPCIYLSSMGVFEELLGKYHPDFLFVTEKSEKIEGEEKDLIGRNKEVEKKMTYFSFYQDGLVYTVNAKGYNSIEQYKEGLAKGFEFGDEYNTALNGEFIDKEEYDACISAGFDDRVEYLRALETGFIGSKDKLKAAHAENKLSDTEFRKVKSYKSDSEVYNFSQGLEFASYDEFEKALASGFVQSDANEYREALEKGFADSEDYYKAKEGGFGEVEEYQHAKSLGINSKGEYDSSKCFSELKEQHDFRSVEQAHLYKLLSEAEAGQKLSVEKVWDMLKDEQAALSVSSSNGSGWLDRPILDFFNKSKQPEWYSTAFKDIVELKVFLISNESLGALGSYDADAEVFERNGGVAETVAESASGEATDTAE